MTDKSPFWTPDKILSYGALLNLVESARSKGKTFGALKHLGKRFEKKGEQFIYLRRHEKDLDFALPTLFDYHVHEGFWREGQWRSAGRKIIFNPKGFVSKEEGGEAIEATEKGANKQSYAKRYVDKSLDQVAGLGISLTDMARMKSVPLPKVRALLFEEYIDENGSYIKNEVRRLLSIIKSVERYKTDFYCLLLGNTISNFNPYYDYIGVYPEEGVAFTHIKSKSCVIERFSSDELVKRERESRFAKLVSGTEYGDFMIENKPLDDLAGIGNMSGHRNFICNLRVNGNYFGVWTQGSHLLFDRNYKLGARTYSLDKDCRPNEIAFSQKRCGFMLEYARHGKCWFLSRDVKAGLEDFLKKM